MEETKVNPSKWKLTKSSINKAKKILEKEEYEKKRKTDELMEMYLLAYVKQSENIWELDALIYIEKKNLTIRIIESNWKYLTIFKDTKVLFQKQI